MCTSPRITIIIPVINEQNIISESIQNARLACGKESEIIIVDGSPVSSTISTINDDTVVAMTSPPGRAVQMNYGARVATGDILIFLHADTKLPQHSADLVCQALNTPSAVAGSFSLAFDSSSRLLKLISNTANLRTRLERVPYGDQAHFIMKKKFHELGNFPEIPIMEDVEFFRNIKKQRMEIIILQEYAITSARRFMKSGPVRCCLRNWLLRLLHLCGVSPFILAKMYSRKVR